MRHRLAEQLAGKQSPAQLGRALNELGIEQIPANSSQAKGHIERIWRTCQDRLVSEFASSTPPPWRKPTPYWPSSASTTTRVSPAPPPMPFATSAPCCAASIGLAASACATCASSPPTTPLPWPHSPLRCRPCPASAATLAKPSNSLINSMAACASFAATNFSARCLCPSKNTPNAALLPSPRRRNEKPRCPHLQPRRPTCSSRRYLIDTGWQSLVAVNTTFSRCNYKARHPKSNRQ